MEILKKDVTVEIMNRLDDKSLGRFCKTNKNAQKICNDDSFWRNRIYSMFEKEAKDVVLLKPEEESFKDFYISNIFIEYRDKVYPLCKEIRNFPHESLLVVDDFYNPTKGFLPKVITRDEKGMEFLLLKIVLLRMEKDIFRNFEEEEKIKKAIERVSNQIEENRKDEYDFTTFDLTAKDKESFYQLIDVNVPRTEMIKIGAKVNPKFFKYSKNAPESFKLIYHIHQGFRKGEIPLDILWDELCTHPYLFQTPEIKFK
jgi:hypothetical protein